MKNKSEVIQPRILLFVDWFSPGFKGGGLITACKNLVEQLDREFRFFIITSDRDFQDNEPYKDIKRGSPVKYSEGTTIFYLPSHSLNRKKIIQLLSDIKPDIIYFNSLFSYRFSILPLLSVFYFNRFKGLVILAPRGMLQQGAMQNKWLKKMLYIRLFRWSGLARKLLFQATDSTERKDILIHFGSNSRVELVEDIPGRIPESFRSTQKQSGLLRCLYLSRISPKKNLEFLLNLPLEVKSGFRIILDIYGEPENPEYGNWCRELSEPLRQKGVDISWVGYITPEEVLETIRKYHLFILPTRGENFGHAIFESLSAGRPVLISDQTPWENLETAKAGWALSLSDPLPWVEKINEAADWDQDSFDAWCRGALDYARAHTHTEELVEKYKEMFGG